MPRWLMALSDDLADPTRLVVVPPPSGGEDSPNIQATIDGSPDGATILIAANALPYQVNLPVIVRSRRRIHIAQGATIQFVIPYDLSSAIFCWTNADGTHGGNHLDLGTIDADVDIGDPHWIVTDVTGLAVGDHIYAASNDAGRYAAVVESITPSGMNWDVKVDKAAWFVIRAGTQVVRTDVLEDFELRNDGLVEGYFTGPYADARIVYCQLAWFCGFTGKGVYRVTQGTPPTAMIGFDVGGRATYTKGPRFEVLPAGGNWPNASGLGIEGQQDCIVNDIRATGLGYTLWINSCTHCDVSAVYAEACVGVIMPTAINVLSATPVGASFNTFRGIYSSNQLPGGATIQFGCDCSDNEVEDVHVQATDPGQVASAAFFFGLNGVKGASRNKIRGVHIDGLAVLASYGVASIGNVISDASLTNVASLGFLSAGSDLKLVNPTGVLTHGTQFQIPTGSSLVVEGADLTVNRAGTEIFCAALGGDVTIRRSTIRHAGAGAEYGFLNNSGTPGGTIIVEDSDLGAWATNFAAGTPADALTLLGQVSYSGAVSGYALNRGSVVLTAATPVKYPLRTLKADSQIRPFCTATGGGSHGPPVFTRTINTTAVAAIGTWPNLVGIASWAGNLLTEVNGGAPGTHYLQSTGATGYVRGPAWARGQAAHVSGAHSWFVAQVGAAAACWFDLVNHVVGTQTGCTGFITVAGMWTLFIPDVSTSADVLIYMANGDGGAGLTYVGDGSVQQHLTFEVHGVNFLSIAAEATNVDTYQIAIE